MNTQKLEELKESLLVTLGLIDEVLGDPLEDEIIIDSVDVNTVIEDLKSHRMVENAETSKIIRNALNHAEKMKNLEENKEGIGKSLDDTLKEIQNFHNRPTISDIAKL